jgi:hydrogenase maturation factor
MLELNALCQRLGITLCGGHTEITDAVTRPVITGMLVGTVDRSRLIKKQNMTQGDSVLLTKCIAVEGTSIIAREFHEKLKSLGMPEEEIDICAQLIKQLSIVEEAKMATESKGTTAMHDVTEGGLATALEELSLAGKHQIRIEMEKIPILPQTEHICRLLDLHPLGLIGSGSLIICCASESCHDLMKKIKSTGIEITKIGEVMGQGTGITASIHDKSTPWPRFEVDELTKLYR